jgi:hypothetical protein
MQIKIKSAFVWIKNLVVKIFFKTFHDLTILKEENYSFQLSIKLHKLSFLQMVSIVYYTENVRFLKKYT